MGRVVDLEAQRVEALARELIPMLRERGSVMATTAGLPNLDRWRKAARRAGRMLGWQVRTGFVAGDARVWVTSDDFEPSEADERAMIDVLSHQGDDGT